ncbi:hypothetical protein [Polycladidibacter stylochi]|nr:hypothetical protein [Pseudovibrio stylochi]
MPTLTRLLSIIGMIVLGVVLSMYALATFVEPTPRQFHVEISNDGLG